MSVFSELGVDVRLDNNLEKLKITEPTDIQRRTIPLALEGKDILGSAQTGTGKTFAFLLPLLTRMLRNEVDKAIIIEPTRELAQQVINNLNKVLVGIKNIDSVLLIGGEPYLKQLKVIRMDPRIFVCTPGRVIDHLKQNNLSLNSCNFVVIDETDKMFDMGFYEQLEEIFKYIPSTKQMLLFSATFPKEIEDLASKHLNNPSKVFVQNNQKANIIADNLEVRVLNVDKKEKYSLLVNELKNVGSDKVIIFTKTKSDVDYLSFKLRNDGFRVGGIHGDVRQRRRERIVQLYCENKFNILIGTDIVARGLDVPNVMFVINYNIPCVPEDYIHRIGRTARAGAKGTAISFITEEDEKYWEEIQRMLYPERYKDIPRTRSVGFNKKRKFFKKSFRKPFKRWN